MGSAEECALVGTLVYMHVRLRVCWKRCPRRLSYAFCMTETVLDKVPENACVFGTRTGYRGRVYCAGLLRTGLLSYVSRKEVCGFDSWEYSTVLRVRVTLSYVRG